MYIFSPADIEMNRLINKADFSSVSVFFWAPCSESISLSAHRLNCWCECSICHSHSLVFFFCCFFVLFCCLFCCSPCHSTPSCFFCIRSEPRSALTRRFCLFMVPLRVHIDFSVCLLQADKKWCSQVWGQNKAWCQTTAFMFTFKKMLLLNLLGCFEKSHLCTFKSPFASIFIFPWIFDVCSKSFPVLTLKMYISLTWSNSSTAELLND